MENYILDRCYFPEESMNEFEAEAAEGLAGGCETGVSLRGRMVRQHEGVSGEWEDIPDCVFVLV